MGGGAQWVKCFLCKHGGAWAPNSSIRAKGQAWRFVLRTPTRHRGDEIGGSLENRGRASLASVMSSRIVRNPVKDELDLGLHMYSIHSECGAQEPSAQLWGPCRLRRNAG